ncbi:MAG: hypothetical protein ABI867_39600 [Kofleriaceae bacterium]
MGIARGLAVVVALSAPAHADVDWAAGQVTAKGLGIADRHAPTPASAREPSRRAAEDQARARLAAELPGLPLATGGTLKAKLADAAIKARIDRAVAAAITIESTPQTDGSWNVTLAVPIEAVRLALVGPRSPPTGSDSDPPIIVVEGVTAKPAVGVTIGGVAAAAIWVTDVPAWAASAPRAKATSSKAGAIELAAKQGGPSTLFVLAK